MEKQQPVQIVFGIPPDYRHAAAVICFDAFQNKFEPIMRSRQKGIEAIEKDMRIEGALAAFHDNQLVGFAGIHFEDRPFLDFRFDTFKSVFGVPKGLVKLLVLSPYHHTIKDGELYLEVLAVREDFRGKGIGSRLLEEVEKFALEEKFENVVLEVIDANSNAKRLYERAGYSVRKITRYPFLKYLFGFTASIEMQKKIM
jgi:GNAT superfamily N-acetyltransferase